MTTIAYLASPYSHPDPAIKNLRYHAAIQATYELKQSGQLVYSPIVHNTPIDQLGIHGNHETWMRFDHTMLSRCNKVIILKIEGWEQSKGIAAEVKKAKELNLPIEEKLVSSDWLDKVAESISAFA